jgi:hypothetical protein
MRIIRRSVLPALVAVGLLAVGASAASASTLVDSSGNPVAVGQSITATGLVKLAAGSITNTCTASLTATVTANSGSPTLSVPTHTFTGCSFGAVTASGTWTLGVASSGIPNLSLSGVNVTVAALFPFTGTLSATDPLTTAFTLGNACTSGNTSLQLTHVGHLTNATLGTGLIDSVDSSGASAPLCGNKAWSLV